ncbi:MAG TPA: type II toxin-antitoxin system RelE/ParE family toxin [Chloroflexi bacterium]|nr:type II toxin-antitoxin system RelE/ParE family toxin [Chloroflexota bacterium]
MRFAHSAAREFRSLPTKLKFRVGATVDSLRENPRPPGVRKLVGHERLYRIRVGRYRVVYEIDDKGQQVLITRIRHRREVYR